jgi:1-pyrroline-5-carboxylate dehydrogenase
MPPVLRHPEVLCVNFTGSFDTARMIAQNLLDREVPRAHFPRFVAETGGKDFLIADANIDVWDTAAQIIAGAFGRTGQKCSANSLVLADRRVWPDLKAAILEQMKSFKTGDPTERPTQMGPVINKGAFESITGFIQRAKSDSKVQTITGGEYSDKNGWFIQPTFFEVDADEHELLSVEIFGPVVAVKTYDHIDQAIARLQKNTYRLTGAICSRDEAFLARYVPIVSEFAGNLYVNRKTTGAVVDQQPFGGDGASGTNYKAGGMYYLLQFLSQGTVTRRHSRTLRHPGIWNWV